MVQLFLCGVGATRVLDVASECPSCEFHSIIASTFAVPTETFFITTKGGKRFLSQGCIGDNFASGDSVEIKFRVKGGIDFQHREGSKTGSGGQMSESQAALERKERLRKLALETIDISKDPYILRNHLGTYECKLCLTLHPNEGNYLAHTQGKRHQSNLARRAAMEARNAPAKPLAPTDAPKKNTIRIGRPGYKVTKSRDLITRQRSLTFEVDYPETETGMQPRHRFMSAYEQKVEAPDKNYQYLLFACDPYETVAFKIPNIPVDKSEGRFFTNWDAKNHKFILQLYFLEGEEAEEFKRSQSALSAAAPPAPRPTLRYN